MVRPMATQQMDAGDLDVGLLRTFLTLVSSGSFGKTAASIDKPSRSPSFLFLGLIKKFDWTVGTAR